MLKSTSFHITLLNEKSSGKYNEFKKIEFPRSPKDNNLEELFVELVQYDEFIAGTMDRIINGETNYANKLYKDEKLMAGITKYLASNNIENKDTEAAKECLAYLQKIENILNEVWRTIK